MAARKRRGSATKRSTSVKSPGRKRRARPVPKWLTESRELDDIARRRCLMILSVLSGEKPVSQVLEEAELSRGTYYQLEQKALEAMLAALVPGASVDGTAAATPRRRIAELEAKVQQLERAKRRTDRLLFLARQVVGPGPTTTGKGPKQRKKRRGATTRTSGTPTRRRTRKTTSASAQTTTSTSPRTTAEVSSSIPVSDGAAAS